MAQRHSTPTCCLTLPLQLEKWQEDRLIKRFEIAGKIYNALLNAELKKLHRLEQLPEYKEIQSQLKAYYQNNLPKTAAFKELNNQRSKLLSEHGFSEYAFKGDMKKFYKHFSSNIGSSVATHCIASQVWSAFEKRLFGGGKFVHFKKSGDIRSLKGFSSSRKSGGVEIMFRGDHIEWKGLLLRLKLDPDNQYESEMLSRRIKYVRIIRKPGKAKWRWYAQLSVEGLPAIKRNDETGEPVHPIGRGAVGIDIGPQTIAYVSQTEVALKELADRVQNIEHEKRLIQRKLDRSRRATNPANYADNGTIKRGVKLTRNKSKRYLKLQMELSFLQHKQAEIRKQQHINLANHLLSLGDCFYVEDMAWSSLARKAKETAVSEKTGKYKRKKRFGKSIANKAPASLISILDQKCTSLGLLGVIKVPTSVRASQYNHITKSYEKKTLSQRWNIMPDGRRIQRDIYSAFLLQHVTPQRDGFSDEALQQDYENFVSLHDSVIQQLRLMPKTIASMGIRRTYS